MRECAEAQGKDFGLVATENGYNLYVCGNGGAVARSVGGTAAAAAVYLLRGLTAWGMTTVCGSPVLM